MMHDTICFEIDEKLLVLDEELIAFTIPIFFICRDDKNQKYAVLCTDSEKLTYIVGKIEIRHILDMLNNTLSLQDFFLITTEKWRILADDDYSSDTVENIEALHDDELPKANTYFELSNTKIEEYKNRLESELENTIDSIQIHALIFQYRMPSIQCKANINHTEPIKPTKNMECITINFSQCA